MHIIYLCKPKIHWSNNVARVLKHANIINMGEIQPVYAWSELRCGAADNNNTLSKVKPLSQTARLHVGVGEVKSNKA